MPIEVKNLTHIYMSGSPFESKALDNVNLHIGDGEFIGIIGHTGSGKSTLVSHLNALEKSAPGQVFVNGKDLGDKNTNLNEIRREVGLVFQYPEYQLFEETVEKDIAFGPNNLKLDEDEVKRRVRGAMALVGLDDSLRSASPFNLSGGQKRRVAIAGVLAMNPSILILDEPAAGLDPAGRRSMLELIRGIHESGVTVVMVSHSMDDVGKYCNRLYVLNHGKVAFEGTPAEVFVHGDELREIGLDVPECAKLAAVLREKGFEVPQEAYSQADLLAAVLKNIGKDVE
ncbi:MAG: energy-coupling factor transporter ATPase [Clostridia bacterium]|nr:energy-coupling factor transporter ATPase [Clostridia bacterium]MBP3653581.1 energy-coupling factor transporter ATPase [Clostridia bacterium]